MTIAFAALGAKSVGGTSTISVPYPASVGAGDLVIAGRACWRSPSELTPSDESGWTSAGHLLGGLGSANDSHQTHARGDYLEAAGGESGSVTFDQAGTGGLNAGALGVMARYTKAGGTTWDITSYSGDDAAHGANRSINFASVDLAPGDMVVAIASIDTDTSLASFSGPTFTASGITWSGQSRRTSGAGVGTGLDGNIELFDAVVSTGTSVVTVTLAFNTTTNQCGPAILLRLREVVAGPVTHNLSATGTGTTSGTAAATATLHASASGIGQTAGSANLIATLGLSASGASQTTGSANATIPEPAATHSLQAVGVGTSGGSAALRATLQFAASATGSATGSARLGVILGVSTTGYSTSHGSLILGGPLHLFSPPTHEEPIRHGHNAPKPLTYYRLTYAASVVNINGTWTQIRTPSAELLSGLTDGVDYFRGGYEYVIDQATARSLVAAGYSAPLI